MTYFEIFDVPPVYTIDYEYLNDKFKRLAQQFHPDKYNTKSSFEQKEAMALFSTINKGYHILSSPIKRAEYLLNLRIMIQETSEKTDHNTDFLIVQMNYREDIEEANNIDDLNLLLEDIKSQLCLIEEKLGKLFQNKEYDSIITLINQGQFWISLEHSIIKKKQTVTN